MIRLTIQRKVFLASFTLAAVLALTLSGLMRWNLEQGFARYAVEAELERLDWMVATLEEHYAEQSDWRFLRGAHAPWIDADDAPRPAPPRRSGRHRPPRPLNGEPPPPDPLGIHPRLALLDPQGGLLAGRLAPEEVFAERPIRHEGRIVATLRLAPQRADETLDTAFLRTQARQLWLTGLFALLLSFVAAWLLARHFLAPIRDLAQGARKLAQGRLTDPIPVRGNDELSQLAADFNTMADWLMRNEDLRRQWVSDSSHELRTPLAVMRAEIEALQDGIRTSDGASLARLHKQIMQMSKLVDDLAKTLDDNNPATRLELSSVAPLPLLREALAGFRRRFAKAGLRLDLGGLPANDPGWRMRADPGRLQQIFSNLLENTLRYTQEGGRLRVTAHRQGNRLLLQFDDTPPAPPPESLPRLFDRFFRAEPSRSRQHGGSGLGLAICKSLVENHGGRIVAEASELGGLCLRIELPLERRSE